MRPPPPAAPDVSKATPDIPKATPDIPKAEPDIPKFDPARATLPMLLEVEPMPVDVPSMRATLPMPLELPKQIEAYFEAQAQNPVIVEGVRLDQVDLFEGLPRPALETLASAARVEQLGLDEETRGFGAALLVTGSAALCATFVDVPAHWAKPAELLVARGSLPDATAVRVVGLSDGTAVLTWSGTVVEDILCAHVGGEARLRARGDRLQAEVGATMGPMGELPDDARKAMFEELNLKKLSPGEIWLEDGAPAPAVCVVGAGEIETYGPISEETTEAFEPGGIVYPDLLVVGGEASSSARAGGGGALVLFTDRDGAAKICTHLPDLAARLRGD